MREASCGIPIAPVSGTPNCSQQELEREKTERQTSGQLQTSEWCKFSTLSSPPRYAVDEAPTSDRSREEALYRYRRAVSTQKCQEDADTQRRTERSQRQHRRQAKAWVEGVCSTTSQEREPFVEQTAEGLLRCLDCIVVGGRRIRNTQRHCEAADTPDHAARVCTSSTRGLMHLIDEG